MCCCVLLGVWCCLVVLCVVVCCVVWCCVVFNVVVCLLFGGRWQEIENSEMMWVVLIAYC